MKHGFHDSYQKPDGNVYGRSTKETLFFNKKVVDESTKPIGQKRRKQYTAKFKVILPLKMGLNGSRKLEVKVSSC